MTSNYTNLAEFLGAYFHQDWTSDADSSMEVAQIYLSEWPRQESNLAMREIACLLNDRSEEEIARIIEGMGCYFVPASEGYASTTDWLRSVEALMRQTLAV
nr:contact-dependent growth inhibition system immunity protein [uncultured Pseudoxanthomonas sp.]